MSPSLTVQFRFRDILPKKTFPSMEKVMCTKLLLTVLFITVKVETYCTSKHTQMKVYKCTERLHSNRKFM